MTPHLTTRGPARGARAVVLLLHGGRERSQDRAPHGVAWLRMVPFLGVARRAAGRDAAVWLLRYRYRGWNAPELPAVADARWALDRAATLHPGAPVVLVGHSMGGRVALHVADAPGVTAVCGLAPWIEPGDDPVIPAGLPLLLAHGDRDRVTDPEASAKFAAQHGGRFTVVPGDGHALLRRYGTWNSLVTNFLRTTLSGQ